MAFVKGVNKVVAIGPESTFGTIATNDSSARILRRVQANLVLTRDAIRSQEILSTHQLRDARLGVKRVVGQVTGQLSPGAYTEMFEGVLRKSFAAGGTTGQAALTDVAAAAGPPGTFTRDNGSFITDGFKVGDVVRWTGWTGDAVANNNRNYRIIDLSATVMTVTGVGDEAVVAAAKGDEVSCSVVGKKTMIPATGHSFKSYTIEQWFPDADTPISERFVGCRVQSVRLNLPPTGMVTIDAQILGRDKQTDSSQYFSSATAATTDNSFVAVNGLLRFNGQDVAIITGAQINIACPMDATPVVGSQLVPDLFPGVLMVDGQFSAYVKDDSLFSTFDAETEIGLWFYLTSTTAVNSPFMTIVMNRVKLFSASKTDGDRAIMQQCAFQALENTNGGASTKYDQTTITIQDSSL